MAFKVIHLTMFTLANLLSNRRWTNHTGKQTARPRDHATFFNMPFGGGGSHFCVSWGGWGAFILNTRAKPNLIFDLKNLMANDSGKRKGVPLLRNHSANFGAHMTSQLQILTFSSAYFGTGNRLKFGLKSSHQT